MKKVLYSRGLFVYFNHFLVFECVSVVVSARMLFHKDDMGGVVFVAFLVIRSQI